MALLTSRRRFVGALALGAAGISLSDCGSNGPGVSAPSSAINDVTVVPLKTPLRLSQASLAPASFVTPATAVAGAIVPPAVPNVTEGLKVGQKLPAFTVAGLDGKPISGAELSARGKPYILFFFATW